MNAKLIQRGGRSLVFGFGLSGQSVVRYCVRQSMPFQVIDTRSLSFETLPDVNMFARPVVGAQLAALCKTQQGCDELLQNVERIVVSPGLALDHPLLIAARSADIPLTNDVQLFVDHLQQSGTNCQVAAVTGSNGKSTVVSALAQWADFLGFPAHALGNIGTAVLDALPTIQDGDKVILELSSFQLELIERLGADCAVLLNLTPDHLDRHGTQQAYWLAKQRIFQGAKTVVVNRDDPLSMPLEPYKQQGQLQRLLRFGLAEPNRDEFGLMSRSQGRYLAHGHTPLMLESVLAMRGGFNLSNVLCIVAMAECLQWPWRAGLAFFEQFNGLPYRCQQLLTNDDITWFNDSKGTNIGATMAAIERVLSIDQNLHWWWIAGGQAKGADFTQLAKLLAKSASTGTLQGCILYGQDARKIQQALQVYEIDVFLCEDLACAVASARKFAQADSYINKGVIFSPACASLDQFANFEERGARFTALVQAEL